MPASQQQQSFTPISSHTTETTTTVSTRNNHSTFNTDTGTTVTTAISSSTSANTNTTLTAAEHKQVISEQPVKQIFSRSYLFTSCRERGLEDVVPCQEIFTKPEGQLADLCDEAYAKLRDSNSTNIVYIMAGIYDILTKDQDDKTSYEEFWLNLEIDKVNGVKAILHQILSKLQSINCKVVFIPVTTMHIAKWNFHQLEVEKTKTLIHHSQYDKMQKVLNLTVYCINSYMCELNTQNNMATPFTQSFVHKPNKFKFRYAFSKLEDGVHPSSILLQSWARKINKAMEENEQRLIKSYI